MKIEIIVFDYCSALLANQLTTQVREKARLEALRRRAIEEDQVVAMEQYVQKGLANYVPIITGPLNSVKSAFHLTVQEGWSIISYNILYDKKITFLFLISLSLYDITFLYIICVHKIQYIYTILYDIYSKLPRSPSSDPNPFAKWHPGGTTVRTGATESAVSVKTRLHRAS